MPPRTRKHKTDDNKARKKRTGKQTWLFTVETGKEMIVHDADAASKFKINYGPFIKAEEHFTTLAAFNARMKVKATEQRGASPVKIAAAATAGTGIPDPKSMSPAEKEGLRKMKLIIENNRANNNVQCSWYTNASSSRAILFIHHKDQAGKDMWFWKASHFCLTMSQHAVQFPHPNPIIQHALTSLRTARMRDNLGGPEKQLEVFVKRKGAPQATAYPSMLAWTHFPIPHDEFSDKEAETDWLKEISRLIGLAIKQIQLTDLYIFALEAAVNSPRMWELMMRITPPNFKTFVSSCLIRVTCCDNLNTQAVLEDTHDMLAVLFEATTDGPKYPHASGDSAGSDADDDDDEANADDDGDGEANEGGAAPTEPTRDHSDTEATDEEDGKPHANSAPGATGA